MTRRLLLGAAAGFPAAALGPPPLGARRLAHVAVVGAGLAGLVAARRLEQAGVRASVFEASGQIGGRVRSTAAPFAPDLVVDLGGAFIDSDHAAIRSLARELGLRLLDLRKARRTDLPVQAFHALGAFVSERSLAQAMRPLEAALAADAARVARDWERFAPAIDAMSATEYLARRAPARMPDFVLPLLAALVRSDYGVEPEGLSALELVFRVDPTGTQPPGLFSGSDETAVVAGGAGRLPEALADGLRGPIHRNRPITAISDRGRDGVLLIDDRGMRFACDAAIIATPLPALRRIALDADLPQLLRGLIAQGRLGRNEKLVSGFRGRPWRDGGAFGQMIRTDGRACAAWDETLAQADHGEAALTYFFGGAGAQGFPASMPIEPLLRETLDRFAAIVPGLPARALPDGLATRWGSDPWIGGSYTSYAPGAYTRFAELLWSRAEGRVTGPASGNLVFAGEHFSADHYGYMNGAVETGEFAAAHVIARS